MSESHPANRPNALPAFRAVLAVVAVVVFLGGLAVAGLTVVDAMDHPTVPVALTASRAIAAALLGLVLATLLVAAGAILGTLASLARAAAAPPQAPPDDVRPALNRLEQSLRLLNTTQSRPDAAPARDAYGGNGQSPLPLLEQLRDLTLMSDAQRDRWAARHWTRRRDAVAESVERDVLVGDWAAAFVKLDDLRLVLPDDPQVAELRERVESEQTSRLDEDMRTARSHVRSLISSAAWPQAEELAAELQRKYPGKADPAALAEDVRREREAFERANMDRLFRDIAAATERRQWRQAVLALEEFIRRYPNDPRADALRLDLPTLVENAAAQERREQEAHFKDLLKNQRYAEAIGVARAAIQKYPASPTATELNKLLPRVEELARQEAAKQQTAAAPAPAAAT
jgi:hypothetical protein